MILFGPARENDASALSGLHRRAFPRGWTRDEFANLLRGPENHALIARPAGKKTPIGFVIARMAAGEAEILSITVAAGHRRRGIARTLMQHLLEDLAQRGLAALFLEVGAANMPALGLYRGLGFASIGRRPGYYGSGPAGDALLFRAALTPPAMVSKGVETDYESPT